MEEDIKILEEQLNTYKRHIENYEKEECLTSVYYELKKYAQALENLIKGYRELEEKLDNSRKANELLNKTNNELRLEIRTTYSEVVNDIISKFNLGDDFIPKSKVKEKIEELKQEYKIALEENSIRAFILKCQIDILEKLMEDK